MGRGFCILELQEELKILRREFSQYLFKKHEQWKASTVSTVVSDSFFVVNNEVGIQLWDCFQDETALEKAQKRIKFFLQQGTKPATALDRANGYFKAMQHLQEFLIAEGGVAVYRQSLAEKSLLKTAWIFQANPKYYDIRRALQEQRTLTWGVKQSKNRIKAGHRVYIWLSGTDGGIIAVGTILEDPEEKITVVPDPYNLKDEEKAESFLGVQLRVEQNFSDKIISRSLLGEDVRTKDLEILRFANATNFPVTEKQADVIESIISGSYKRLLNKEGVEEMMQNRQKKYWLYAPGENSRLWEEFYKQSIMAIGWDQLGDLEQYSDKAAIKIALRNIYGNSSSYVNAGYANWQFMHEINVGDVIFVKQGLKKIIGRGIVTSDYRFDDARKEYFHVRSVKWTHKGEWDRSEQMAQKTLTDITSYTDYCKKIESLFCESEESESDEVEIYDSYMAIDFLTDVFMDEGQYGILKNLLLRKKNLILQGSPGVGKTYAAERLAYSIMGEKDTSRVMAVQFHQSYSYEDFIMGYRPTETGFILGKGPFYEFCKLAELDDRPYFFIIDEINRGNLSKIFGELLMLIENDKRGKSLRLLYSDEQFSVPPNVHIIGMMNTADRSLAMIDYALRRRFAFFSFEPAFDSAGFKLMQEKMDNPKFNALVNNVKEVNECISQDECLGEGFKIGHSYLCSDVPVTDEWIEDVIYYELLPLLKEYWFDEPEKVEQWKRKLCGILDEQY